MRRFLFLVVFGAVAGVVALTGCGGERASGDQRAARWGISDLGALEGWPGSEAVAINERGQIVGNCFSRDGTRAVLWQDGRLTNLGTLGGRESEATAINEQGQIVGSSFTKNGDRHGTLWQNAKTTDLGALPGARQSAAVAINNKGQTVGYSQVKGGGYHAVLWQNGKMEDLSAGREGESSEAVAINDRAQVIGTRDSGSGQRAFLWERGTMIDLGTVGLGTMSKASAINEIGEVVGSTLDWALDGSPLETAVSWTHQGMTVLETPNGFANAGAINDKGQIVGTLEGSRKRASHAVSWQDGKMTDLDVLGGSAVAINAHGQIIGTQDHHGFVWDNGTTVVLRGLNEIPDSVGEGDSQPSGLNDHGQIIGTSQTKSGTTHAVVWTLRSG